MMVVIVQARVGSTRLPGKVLLPLAGKPLLERMLERLRSARFPFELIVATTPAAEDDPIVRLARRVGVRVFRGHPTDLVDRHLAAAREVGASAVVKIPSDCPLIAPEIVERMLAVWEASEGAFDYLSNLRPPSYPDGNDVEVMSVDVLEQAWREATLRHEREHTTPFIWERPIRFRIANVSWETGLDYSATHRLTIDHPEDYALISAIYDELCTPFRPVFSLREILELLEQRPEWRLLNARHHGASWYVDHIARRGAVATAPSFANPRAST